MELWSIFLIALGVSSDAFAVALCRGVTMRRLVVRQTVAIAVTFAVFQAVMPLIGWLIGTQLQHLIESWDHWIAFGLLAIIGGKLAWDGIRSHENERLGPEVFRWRPLLMLAVATSIDALAVGVSFAFVEVPIVEAVLLIGVTTLVLTFVGVLIGHRAGVRFRKPAEIIGGLVLIAIGVKILLEHLGVL